MTVPDLDPELISYVKWLADQEPGPGEPSSSRMTPERQELLHRLLEPTTESTEPTQGEEQDGKGNDQEGDA